MPRSKAAELRNLSGLELSEKRRGLEKELFNLRQKKVSGQLDKPHFFKMIKRQIAQLHTIQSENSRPEKKNAAV